MHMGYRALDRIVISSRSQKHYKHVLLSEFVTKHEFMKVGWKRRCVRSKLSAELPLGSHPRTCFQCFLCHFRIIWINKVALVNHG